MWVDVDVGMVDDDDDDDCAGEEGHEYGGEKTNAVRMMSTMMILTIPLRTALLVSSSLTLGTMGQGLPMMKLGHELKSQGPNSPGPRKH